jgi:hypothetical protein
MNLRLSMMKIFRFAAATGSVLTMVFSPVAHGLQSEETLKTQIETFTTETQLNKRTTYKEFWQKTKHLYSGQVYKDVERYFMQSPNELMPEITIKESVSTTGEKIPTLTMSENGKSYNIQIFGEKNKFAKFNNVVLTENDLMLITPAMKRIMASDIKIRKAHDKNIITPVKEKFSGTPQINREMWKKMSPTQRAEFMLNLRLLWSGASDVLEAKEALDLKKDNKSKKTSSLDKWNNFFAMLNKAEADPAVGTNCVVAGYIGTYGAGKSCQYPKDVPRTAACNFPCNSTIYGNNSDGTQFCLKDNIELQTATHYNKGCDAKMPLTAIQLSLPKVESGKGSARYKDVAAKNKAEALAALNDTKVQDLTQRYLASMLKGDMKSAFEKGELSDTVLTELKKIQTEFDRQIESSREACAAAADSVQYDKNFVQACDQLHRRFLFVAEFLTKKPGCPDNKSVDPETLKCPCAGGASVIPGKDAKCAPVAVATGETTVADAATVVGGSEEPPLQCKDGTSPSPDKKACVCEDGKEPKEGKKCGSGFNWKPWAIGAGILLLAAFLFKKKKKDKPVTPVVPDPPQGCQNVCAANTIQNPTTCACDPIIQPPTCAAPMVPTGSSCACPASNACTPGQQTYNLNTCQCDTVVQPGTCPDGTTTYYTPPGPSTCPAPTQCQYGPPVYPPAVCAPAPTEGGSGDNCPSGDCNGGVPTGN